MHSKYVKKSWIIFFAEIDTCTCICRRCLRSGSHLAVFFQTIPFALFVGRYDVSVIVFVSSS